MTLELDLWLQVPGSLSNRCDSILIGQEPLSASCFLSWLNERLS